MSWKEKREMRLRYSAEADGYDELYSDEQRTKYEVPPDPQGIPQQWEERPKWTLKEWVRVGAFSLSRNVGF